MTNQKSVFLLLFLAVQTLLSAQNISPIFWTKIDESRIPTTLKSKRQIVPQRYDVMELDFGALKQTLLKAPERLTPEAASQSITASFPMPDGSSQTFRIEEASVMQGTLQAKYPSIRSFVGYSLTDRHTMMRCEFSENGFSAMIFATNGIYFIDPYALNNTSFYIVYDKKDFTTDKKMDCQVTETIDNQHDTGFNNADRTGDGNLRIYRLALACTGEYAAYHGGTIPKVMAAMNKTMTRVNGVYEKEHSITFSLVGKNDTLIFLNPNTDPYTNNNGSTMLGQNQTACDQLIGTANYDIGHVFSTGGGGIASLQSPCKSGSKARGVTGLSAPVNDPFDIDYVTHEMGHQCGGEHTFNNSCSNNISTGSSYEPGSGSSIMGYAGICPPNVQNNSDAYFHLQSLLQINSYMIAGGGNTCAQRIVTENTAQPNVSAGADYTIPKGTPFELTAAATDADGDPLTYCWEQWDREVSTATGPQAPKATNTTSPAFRSYYPNPSPTRIFPNLTNLTKNTNNTWEVLSNVTRKYNFRVTARDNHNGFGRADFDQMTIQVDAIGGPFLVTAPNTAVAWEVLSKQTVTWNVAGTDLAPFNTANVNILLSSDGGFTYPDTIATNIPNTGSYQITVPNKPNKKARIKVKAANNIFFDISNADFEIKLPPAPTFVFGTNQNNAQICNVTKDSLSFDLSLTALIGYKENVKLSGMNIPTGAKLSFSKDTLTPSGTIKVVLYDLKKATNGNYDFKIIGTGITQKDTIAIPTSIANAAPITVKLLSPMDFKGISLKNDFLKWKKNKDADRYTVEISKDFLLTTIDETKTLADTSFSPTKLQLGTVYFWRVKATNPCGTSTYSETAAFQTIEQICESFSPNNLPLTIPTNNIIDTNLDFEVTGLKKVALIEAKMQVNHTYISDLTLALKSPDLKKALIIDNKCSGNDNIDATFLDTGGTLTCSTTAPTIKGNVKPQEPFSIFNGINANGTWKLQVEDIDGSSAGGAINTANLKICYDDTVRVDINLVKNELKIVEGNIKAINTQFLNITSPNTQPNDLKILITRLPIHGILQLGATPIPIGTQISMQLINAGALLYNNNIGSVAKDSFQFMVFTNTKGWIPTTTFPISVLTGAALTINAAQTKAISCFGAADAQISIDILGGKKPYQFSIDGGTTYKDTSNFFNLAAGKYLPIVKDSRGVIKEGDTIFIKNPELLETKVLRDSNNIYITIKGGTKPYLINFNNKGFAKTDTFKIVPNGKYVVSVKDANNCTAIDTVSVFVNSIVASTTVNKTIKCYGEKSGEIKITTFGAKAPITYQINSEIPQSSNTFSNLGAGDYTIKIKDADNFTKTLPVVKLNNPDSISAIFAVIKDSLYVDGKGGNGLLAYDIGSGFTDKNTFPNIPNGSYTLSIKDINDCIKTYTFKIAVEPNVAATDFVQELGVSLAPNPASDDVTLRFNTSFEKNINLIINDLQGKIILKTTIPTDSKLFKINIADFPNATYQVVLKNGEKIGVMKLVVIK